MTKYKIISLIIFMIMTSPVFAWNCDSNCSRTQVDCLAYKKLNCSGEHRTGVGCGSGWNTDVVPDRYGGADFTEACKNHDACYETCESSQHDCDVTLRDEMKDSCKSTFHKAHEVIVKNSCLKNADLYYEMVKRNGSDAFSEAQKGACVSSDITTTKDEKNNIDIIINYILD